MKVKLILLATTVLAVGQSYSEHENSFSTYDQKEGALENTKESVKHPLCPIDEDPVNPTVLPYPGDCSKFYKCLHGSAYPISCPSGLHWSTKLNRCDWPEIAKCDPNIQVPSTDNPVPSTPVPSTTPGEPTSKSPEGSTEGPVKHPLCPVDEDPVNPTVLPYPGDCTKFYKCLHGHAYPISCPSGLHWSSTLNRCDWPEVARCDPNSSERPDLSTKAPVISTTPGLSTTTPNPATDGPVKHPLCPENEDPANPTVLPYPGDCSKFYKCLHGHAYPISCPSGLHWGAKLNRCDWPEVAKCAIENEIESSKNLANPTETPIQHTKSPSTPKTTEPPVKHSSCPEDEDPEKPTFLPYPKDCSKFYKCLHDGFAIVSSCPKGLHWNVESSRCDWPEKAKCDPNIQVTSTMKPVRSTENPVTSTTIAKSTEAPTKHPLCPKDEDPEKPTFLPYPGDCTKFYKCMFGLAYPASCPSGLHWSVELNQCDWPETAKCDPNVKGTTTERPVQSTEKTTPSTSTTAATPTTSTEPSIKHSGCPKEDDPKNPVLLPYPGDCSKFYKCVNGWAKPASCPSGLHWNVKRNRCDWPKIAKCDPNVVVKDTTPSLEDPKKTNELKLTTPATLRETTPKKEVTIEAGICNYGNKLVPHSSDCTKFIQCADNVQVERSCPIGTHFNANLMICDYPEKAGCQKSEEVSAKDSLVSDNISSHIGINKDFLPVRHKRCLDSDKSNPLKFAHPKYCEVFLVCYKGFALSVLCPRGTHWNDNLKKCDDPKTAGCKKESPNIEEYFNNYQVVPVVHKDCPISDDPEHPVHLPYPNDCTRFYKCVGQIAHPMSCPLGQYWSIELDRCDWPRFAKCTTESQTTPKVPTTPTIPKMPPTTSTPASSPIVPSTTTTTIMPSTTTTTVIPSTTKQPISEQPVGSTVCKNAKDNELLPYPKDCTKYIQCFNNKDFVQRCPSGLHWNEEIKYCDYPQNTKCQN